MSPFWSGVALLLTAAVVYLMFYGTAAFADEAVEQEVQAVQVAVPTVPELAKAASEAATDTADAVIETVEEVEEKGLSFFDRAKAIMSGDNSALAEVVSADLAADFERLAKEKEEVIAAAELSERALANAIEQQAQAEALRKSYADRLQSLAACVSAATGQESGAKPTPST